MCRIFGFRSQIISQVHSSLVSADNALMNQSPKHPDGWGVAYYVENTPQLVRSLSTAINDKLFKKVSGLVAAQTVLAHLRKATIGNQNILNTHPFQHGRWTFVHNGNIKNFDQHRSQLENWISPIFKRLLLGETDSEVLFFIILTEIYQKAQQLGKAPHQLTLKETAFSAKAAILKITQLVGPCNSNDAAEPTETFLTFVLTDGDLMLGYQGGKNLYYSTHKTRCPDRNHCTFFNNSCENPIKTGGVNHLIFSSEPLKGSNVWKPIAFDSMVGVNRKMDIWIEGQ